MPMTKDLYRSKLDDLFDQAEKETRRPFARLALEFVRVAAEKNAEAIIAAMPESVTTSASTAAFDWNTFLDTIEKVLSNIPGVGIWVGVAISILRLFTNK